MVNNKRQLLFINILVVLLLFFSVFVIYEFNNDKSLETSNSGSLQKTDAQQNNKNSILSNTAKLRIPFIENIGQAGNDDIRFYASTFAGSVYVTKKGEIVYSFLNNKAGQGDYVRAGFNPREEKYSAPSTVTESLSGCKEFNVKGTDRSETKVNYFVGNKENWKTGITSWNEVSYGEVYDNIELKLHAYGKNIEKVFTVNPGGKVEDIKLTIGNAQELTIDKNGELVCKTSSGNISFTKPYAYQLIKGKKAEVDAEYFIKDKELTYGFKVAYYNKQYTLIIDPLLASTFIGGKSNGQTYDVAYSISKDSDDNIFVCGSTDAIDFASDADVYNKKHKGSGKDVFVLKFKNSDLSRPEASVILGGSSSDTGHAIALDFEGNIFVAGTTDSNDFPLASREYTTHSYSASNDAFIVKLSNNLNLIKAAKYIGGRKSEDGNALAIDLEGNVYIAGTTASKRFAVTHSKEKNLPVNPHYQSSDNKDEIFISKFDNKLNSLLSSTFLGGSRTDSVTSIAVDTSGNVFLGGNTLSPDFPVGSDLYGDSYFTFYDLYGQGFISKFTSDLSTMLSSTFLGGKYDDYITDLKIDGIGDVVVTGYTHSFDFPVGPNNYDKGYSNQYDVFVSKLDNNLKYLLASTLVGGDKNDYASSIAFDSAGNIYLTGKTLSKNFPVDNNSYDSSQNGNSDIFLCRFDKDLKALSASTYIGGNLSDTIHSTLINGNDEIIVTGATRSSDFPVTSGAYDESFNGGDDAFVTKIDSNLSSLIESSYISGKHIYSNESAESIAVDLDGNVYVTGNTTALKFPLRSKAVKGSYDRKADSSEDVFVFKLNEDLDTVSAFTFLGGNGIDEAVSIAVDNKQNVYVSGNTRSDDFPVSDNAFQKENRSKQSYYPSGFVVRLTKNLDELIAGTYLGGKKRDQLTGMALGSDGSVYVAGYTISGSFPVTQNAFDRTISKKYKNEDDDIFVSRLSKDLRKLLSSTFLGGKMQEKAIDIVIDSNGNAFLTGFSSSKDYPLTDNAYDSSAEWGKIVVSKLDKNLENLLASTFIGGSGSESAKCIAVDSEDNIYIAGTTDSDKFPGGKSVNIRSPKNHYRDYEDIFVSMFDNELSNLMQSALIGGSNYDSINSIAIDNNDNVFLIGRTSSSDFPSTSDNYTKNEYFQYNNKNIVILLLSKNLKKLDKSIILGGNSADYGNTIAFNKKGDVIIAGGTQSYDFPVVKKSFDNSFNGGTDIFVAFMTNDMESLFPRADLVLSNFKVKKLLEDKKYKIRCVLSNHGETESGFFKVKYYLSSKRRKISDYNDVLLKQENILHLGKGKKVKLKKKLTLPDYISTEKYFIKIVVDEDNIVPEIKNDNNIRISERVK